MDLIEHTRNLKLPLLVPNQSGKEFTHNEALIIIDNIMHNAVIDILDTPPDQLSLGQKYIVGANAAGAFQNKENQIAIYDENGWIFIEIKNNHFVWVVNRNGLYVFKNENWEKLDIYDNRLEITEPKANEILKYNGTNFVNSDSLVDLKELSVAGNVVVGNNINSNKIRLDVGESTSNINVSNDNENWLNCISINNNNGKINFEKDVTVNGKPVLTEKSLEIKNSYSITANVLTLEFTGIDDGNEHVIIMYDLQSNKTQELLYCRLGSSTAGYVTTGNYYWNSQLYTSDSTSITVYQAQAWGEYLLSTYNCGESGIKTTVHSYVELHIHPTDTYRVYMEATVNTGSPTNIKSYNITKSSCMYCKDPKPDKIRFYLQNSAYFRSGKVKHYVIK